MLPWCRGRSYCGISYRGTTVGILARGFKLLKIASSLLAILCIQPSDYLGMFVSVAIRAQASAQAFNRTLASFKISHVHKSKLASEEDHSWDWTGAIEIPDWMSAIYEHLVAVKEIAKW